MAKIEFKKSIVNDETQTLRVEERQLFIATNYGTYANSLVSVSVEDILKILKDEGIITDGNVIAS